jgi:hypothetical protein
MNRIIGLFFFLLGFGLNQTYSQISLDKLNKGTNKVTLPSNKSLQSTALANLDAQLKKKYNLANVKSELLGDSLAINIADSKLNGLNQNALNKQAGTILESAVDMLKTGNVKTGIRTVAVNLLKNINLKDVLARASKKL